MAGTGNTAQMDKKCAEMVLYIAQQSEDDPDFGATKLNKILLNVDFIHYAQKGAPISGQEYQALDQGPCVRRLLPIQKKLIAEGRAAIQETFRGPYLQKRLIALRDPDLSVFSGEEIALIDRVISRLRGFGARGVSDLSHRFVGWRVARKGETIPYETMFVSERELTQEEWLKGAELEPSGAPVESLSGA